MNTRRNDGNVLSVLRHAIRVVFMVMLSLIITVAYVNFSLPRQFVSQPNNTVILIIFEEYLGKIGMEN